MAEAFGIVISAGQALQAVVESIKRLKKAYSRQKELTDFLDRYRLELLAINEQIDRIEKDKALQTSDVLATISRLKVPRERLNKWLKKLGQWDKRAGFVNQLIHGNTERTKLEDILGDLTRIKIDLGMAITRAVSDRAKKIEKGVAANGEGIRELKGVLMDGPVNGSGQRVVHRQRQPRPQRNQGTESSDNGSLSDRSDDCRFSDSSKTQGSPEPSGGSTWKIVTDNTSDNGSVMLNAPVGPDDVWNNSSVEISGNKVDNGGIMINHPNKKEDIEAIMELSMKWLSLTCQSRQSRRSQRPQRSRDK